MWTSCSWFFIIRPIPLPPTGSWRRALSTSSGATAGSNAGGVPEPNQARFVVFSGHVHNYEHQEHDGVTYFVTGGGGARPYPIERTPDDPLNGKSVNYHYLLVEVDRGDLKITMHRLDLTSGAAVWTQPDSVEILLRSAKAVTHGQ